MDTTMNIRCLISRKLAAVQEYGFGIQLNGGQLAGHHSGD